ncbi:MAG: EMC3/TMCO1 family protein [archaeon]|nr:EMC3/TMCO1 family protein [archaeon]
MGAGLTVVLGNMLLFPLLDINPVYAIGIIAVFLSLVYALLNKIMVNQEKLRHVKKEMKRIQAEIKKARAKNDEKELKSLWDKSMKVNHQQLTMVMKPMIASMVFIFLIFPWMGYYYGDVVAPINESQATFNYDDAENQFKVDVKSDGSVTIKDLSSGKICSADDKIMLEGKEWIVEYKDGKNENDAGALVFKVMRVKLPFSLPLVGGYVGWLGLYIIFSIPATIVARKLMGVQ